MATYQVSPPEQFDFSRPDEWQKWARRFERFRKASGLEEKPEEAQVNTLIYAMGDAADDILRSFQLSEQDSKTYQTVKGKFDSHFIKKRNVIYERARFNLRHQEEGEAVDTFITALYGLAEYCGYGDLHDEMIRDRIVVGIRDAPLAVKLQLDAELTLDKAVRQVRQAETVKSQQPLLRGGDLSVKPDNQVGAVSREKGGHKYVRPRQGSGVPAHKQPAKAMCGRCGRPPHDRQLCPARDAVCHKCNKRGHFKSVCRSSANVQEVNLDPSETRPEGEAFLGSLTEQGANPRSPWALSLLLNRKPTHFELDTGAEVSVISPKAHQEVGSPSLRPAQRVLRGPCNHALTVKGQFTGKLRWGDREVDEEIFVVGSLKRQLLGRPAIEALHLVTHIGAIEDPRRLNPFDQFPNLFRGLGKLEGNYSIKLQEGAKPFSLSVPRRVAIPLRNAVTEELERMERLGVIARVTEPTEWCAGMVVVPKANNKVRICVDLTHLNQTVQRERHPLPAVEQTLAQLAGARLFSKLDANSGFWQIPLSPESASLTTFITPQGRYCFHRLPFGITSAPEHFQRRMSDLLSGFEGVVCMTDDVLVHGRTTEEHDQRLARVLRKLEQAGLTLNREKCRFSQTQVKFLGHVIDQDGIRPDPDKVKAIRSVQPPNNVGDVRRFLGMVNHLSKFSPNLAEKTQPLRELLHKTNQWMWGEPQQQAFQEIKQALMSSPVLAFFDPNCETVVSADASSHGLGAVLVQKQPDGEFKPISYISRSLSATEQRYAQIEKEALAFTWACERFSDYLLGLTFHIHTDHKPLVPLFSSKNLDELPVSVQRFRMRMMRYNFTISHVPGKSLLVADTLSRAPATDSDSSDTLLEQETAAYVTAVWQNLPATDQQLDRIKRHQEEDEVCQQVATYCQSGWPTKQALAGAVKPYYSVSSELSVQNGLLMRGNRIVIPTALRLEMLDKLHTGHLGITKCRDRARQSVWWPGLSRQLEELVKGCTPCCKVQNQRAEPLIPSVLPDLPWQRLGTDLFVWDKSTYLLVVDYYSRFIEIARLQGTTAEEVILHTKSMFARHGLPEVMVSDNGPQYSSEAYAAFAREYQFEHVTSSPHYPQANGEAERAVQTIKGLLKKEGDPYLALLAYRATPLQNRLSPSELLMSRRLRTTVPMPREQLKPQVPDLKSLKEREERLKTRQQSNFDRYHGVRELPPLWPGQKVWMPDRETEAQVVQEAGTRSYEVQTSDGTYRRNRRALVQLPDPPNQAEVEGTEGIGAGTADTAVRRSSREPRPPDRLDPSWNT